MRMLFLTSFYPIPAIVCLIYLCYKFVKFKKINRLTKDNILRTIAITILCFGIIYAVNCLIISNSKANFRSNNDVYDVLISKDYALFIEKTDNCKEGKRNSSYSNSPYPYEMLCEHKVKYIPILLILSIFLISSYILWTIGTKEKIKKLKELKKEKS